MRGIVLLSCKLQSWQEKAKLRSQLISELRKRILEIVASRLMWKRRYYELKIAHEQLQNQVDNLGVLSETKVAHHSYTAEQISLSLRLRHEGNCSYRSCVLVMEIFSDMLALDWSIPSHSSVYNWDVKLGYAKLHQIEEHPKTYALIMDESISIGSEKILVLSGVDLARYDFTRPLNLEDLKILDIGVGRSWKSVDINPRIERLQGNNITFKYGCSDNGVNLRKSLRDNNLAHLEDCGHALGNLMQKKYKQDVVFKAFNEELRKFRLRITPSKHAECKPPKWRSKGRFMNIWEVCNWAYKMLNIARTYKQEKPRKEVFLELEWLLNYELFIEQIYTEQSLINSINKELKTYGLSKKTLKNCKAYIVNSTQLDANLQEEMNAYLDRNWTKVKGEEKVVISSDVIESTFGKFKNSVANHPQGGITCGCLTIANYDKQVSSQTVQQLLPKVTNKDIETWRVKNIGISIFQKKKKLFKNTG